MADRLTLPPLPEPDGYESTVLEDVIYHASEHPGDKSLPVFSRSKLLSDRAAVWRCAMEAAITAAKDAEPGDGSHDYNAGAETMQERVVAALLAMPVPQQETPE